MFTVDLFIYTYILIAICPPKKKKQWLEDDYSSFFGAEGLFPSRAMLVSGRVVSFLGQGSEKNHDPTRWAFRTDCDRWGEIMGPRKKWINGRT